MIVTQQLELEMNSKESCNHMQIKKRTSSNHHILRQIEDKTLNQDGYIILEQRHNLGQ